MPSDHFRFKPKGESENEIESPHHRRVCSALGLEIDPSRYGVIDELSEAYSTKAARYVLQALSDFSLWKV